MYEVYEIEENDTIDSISDKFDVTKEELYYINGFDSDSVLEPGKFIVVPKTKKQPYVYYTVKKGDSPYEIAKNYGVDYKVLLALNGLDDNDYIYPNQTLLLPGKGVKLYLTGENDTLNNLLNQRECSIDELLKENENIYLGAKQIIVFREK